MGKYSATLSTAKKEKNDEFYTQLSDIENEIRHYKEHFKNKIVYCNCDDPYESNFFKYFSLNFNALGLKKLIAISYAGSFVAGTSLTLFEDEGNEHQVTNKKGIYEYLLDGKEKHLSIRAFLERDKRSAYEKQKGKCPLCGEHFELSEMHADHIKPWSKGGKTIATNCQMLCTQCNIKKGNK